MYRSVLFRCLPIRQMKKECFSQAVELRKSLHIEGRWSRHLSVSVVCSKKRRSDEERVAERQGRRVIRYSPKAGAGVVGVWRDMTVRDIAQVLGKDLDQVYQALEFADKTSETRYGADTVVRTAQVVRDVVKLCGFRFRFVPRPGQEMPEEEEDKDALPAPPAPAEALRPRPPVACVMGHVDHGKTTLLDALRDSRVVDQEFGGITQHIGAFEVPLPTGERVTFLDTPGHAAFSAMRARGAGGADVVVLVVAADDGVMEQTVESIRMAREANVPILVAINKIDKPGVNIERTMQSLAAHGVVCEALGGEVQAVAVSALHRRGLKELLEALTLQATLLDLKADPEGPVEGVVLEAQMDQRSGKQATVLVQRGALRRGCVLVAGAAWAKVRVLLSSEGRELSSAGPATPARVLGWRELPAAGDQVLEVPSEKRAGEVMRWRRAQRMREKQQSDMAAIEDKEAVHQSAYKAVLARKRAMGRMRLKPEGPRQKMLQDDTHPALHVLIKGDVDGSVEAILDILDTYDEHERVKLELVHFGVGPITQNDLEIAEAFEAVVYAFNVPVPLPLAAEAKRRGLKVKEHNVIYRLVDDVREEISARIPVTQEEEVIGEANVLQQFSVSEGRRRVPVAGCRCVRGALARAALYRVERDGQVVYQGKLASMKHLKDEVSTVKCDTECGLRFEDPTLEVRPGDTVVCYRLVDVAAQCAWDPGF